MTKSIRALTRGLEIIRMLSTASSLSLGELSKQTDLPKASVLRYLATLIEENWVYRGLGDGRYRLRSNLCIRDLLPDSLEQLIEVAGPTLRRLQTLTESPSDIAVRDQNKMRILETSRRVSGVLNYDVIGFQPHILWSAMGRAYFAYCPDHERIELITALKHSQDRYDRIVTSAQWVEQLIHTIRVHGYATRERDYWGHAAPVPKPPMAIAVPIIRDEQVIASLSIVWESGMDEQTRAKRYLSEMQKAAQEIVTRLEALQH